MSSSLVEVNGSSHHPDGHINFKSKVTSPLGLFRASLDKKGHSLALIKKNVFGGDSFTASTSTTDNLDLMYSKEVNDGSGGSLCASVGLKTSFLEQMIDLRPRVSLKYNLGKMINATLSCDKFSNHEELVGDLLFNHKFDITRDSKGLVKAQVKQIVRSDGIHENVVGSLTMSVNEADKEYAINYNHKQRKCALFHAMYLPKELELHYGLIPFIPTAVAVKMEVGKKLNKMVMFSYGLANRESAKSAPSAINLMVDEHCEANATLVHKALIPVGEKPVTAVMSVSARSNLKKITSQEVTWGVKFDIVGDWTEFPLTSMFGGSFMSF
eukprot:GHVH01011036.1.p1 GENE.GHVH01011036.1~~GHVH01011036.1.p1  ORF type:complete len:326 (-),score=46.24 GHVH01011036.1:648-1625(-)